MSNILFCKHCLKNVTFTIVVKSNQQTAWCNSCGMYIKNIPYTEPRLFVGKYKEVPISEIEDISYLVWAILNLNVSQRVKRALIERVNNLNFLAR